MFEELKNQLESLSQEVALLKEQQALQTGECRRWRLGPGVRQREGLRPAASLWPPASTRAPAGSPRPVLFARAPGSGNTLFSRLPLGEIP